MGTEQQTMSDTRSKMVGLLKGIISEAKKKPENLNIVSTDHVVNDSPNASHINEHLGRSTAMMAIKTLAKRQSVINRKSRPLAKRVRKRYVFEDADQEKEVVSNNKSTDNNSPKDKKTKPEKKGDLVTVNPKLDDNK